MANAKISNAGQHWKAALRFVAICACAATLAGCNTQREATIEYPNDYRQRHPITLMNGHHTVEVFLGRNRGGLNPSQRADVLAFAHSWKRDATSGILIEVPRAGASDRAGAASLREINSILAASGMPSAGVRMRSYRPSGATLASIKLSYSRLVAHAGPCGKWPSDIGPSDNANYTENRNYWNLGCATQRNLAAMVDNPADLVQPRGETPAPAGRRSVMMEKYRKGEVPSATYPNDASNGYGSGKISDIGK
jgi:pilus assembly protein CpaD